MVSLTELRPAGRYGPMNIQPNMRRSWHVLFLCLIAFGASRAAQVPPNRPRQDTTPQNQDPQNQPTPSQRPSPQDEVIKVFTELVQTDVMVFDKQGHFVNGLTRDAFALRVDGQLRPIQSFDLINAGSTEEAQLAAARGGISDHVPPPTSKFPNRPVPLDRGRTVFFYVDDYHLDPAGLTAARKAISDFVDKEMGQNDQTAITTATGQIGFLQQLTNNRTVLHEAIERMKARQQSPLDADRPAMTEYDSLLIDRNDYEVLEFFVDETIRLNPGMTRDVAAGIVHGRAQSIQSQAGLFNSYLLAGLENWVRSLAGLPGRKVLFLLSNGFLISNRSDSIVRMQKVTSAAAKSGVVIYSLDVRGLTGEAGNASRERPFDPMGRLQRATLGEFTATQDGMNALARDTGGKPIFNTNDFRAAVTNAVKETAVYYLLAWKPDSDNQKTGRFRNIEVVIVGRPELTVRVRRGFYDRDPADTAASPNDSNKPITAKLRDALIAPYPQNGLPISLSTVYYDVPSKGPTVFASIQIPGEFMTFGPEDAKIQAVVDVTGVFLNLKGEPVNNFLERIVTTGPNAEAAKDYRRDITYSYPATIPPGLYQVRVAARDERSGRIGTAHSWIEIPDIANKRLAMSSLLLGERTQAMMTINDKDVAPINKSASQRFKRESNLRFLFFTYNSEPSTIDGKPDVAIQIQIVRDNQPVITSALRKMSTDGVADLARLPYAAEVSLNALIPGQYVLQITVIDRVSKQSISQQTHFEVY